MKYADEEWEIRMLITEKHPFKGAENYYIDSLFYQDSLEIAENPSPTNPEPSNEADAEQEPKEECLW